MRYDARAPRPFSGLRIGSATDLQTHKRSGGDFVAGLNDPALADFLGLSVGNLAGVSVTESSALGFTALFRAVSIIAGTIAGLPLKTYRNLPDGQREQVSSFLDDPAGTDPDGLTPYEFVEFLLVCLLLHGNWYALRRYNEAGAVIGLMPIHPRAVEVTYSKQLGRTVYKVTTVDGETRVFTSDDVLHIPALTTDGVCGVSPLKAFRDTIATGLAGDQAAARMFGNGALIGGLVTTEEDVTEDEARAIKSDLNRRTLGVKNAGDVAFVNRTLKFTPWTTSSKDAQFLESRAHQVEEIARAYGVPKVLLAQDGASTWGSGIAELNRGLAKFTLMSWTTRIEQRLSRLLARPRFVEFDYAGLMQGAPAEEITLLIEQVNAGLLTPNEARAIRNLPPLPVSAEVPPSEEAA